MAAIDRSGQRRVTVFGGLLMGVWTAALIASVLWNTTRDREHIDALARAEAVIAFKKDVLYRRWAAYHGGVYVQVSEQTPPNEHLAHIAERDLVTPSGRRLTLMNPAYMTRQIHAMSSSADGALGRITSLRPIRPENAPNEWERRALEEIERGAPEVVERIERDGAPFLQLMRPLRTGQSCLKCHAAQGYRLGDLRGGLAVAVPLERYAEIAANQQLELLGGHAAIWLLGMGMLLFGTRRMRRAERSRAAYEAQLRRSEEHQRLLLRSAAESIYGLDVEGRCTFCNPSCVEALGYDSEEQILGRRMHPLIHHTHPDGSPFPEEECQLRASCRDGVATHRVDELLWRADGSSFIAELRSHPVVRDGAVVGAVVTFLDTTERREIEKRAQEAQKLEAIGTLAGGIAHDFNNALSAITVHAELVRMQLPDGSPAAEDVASVLQASKRARSLVKQVLTFSRKSELSTTAVDLRAVVREAAELLRAVSPSTVTLEIAETKEALTVDGDPTQLHQVVVNLCTNAFQAAGQTGGEVTVRLGWAGPDAPEVPLPAGLSEGAYAFIEVRDSGPGIDPEHLPRLFDPFFSTKAPDVGTGLGLSVVHSVVQAHRGAVTVDSEPGAGACFRVFLPSGSGGAPQVAGPSTQRRAAAGRILLAEDDDLIRRGLVRYLEREGFEVVAAHDGSAALEAFQADPRGFDVVVTDQTMPNLTGDRLVGELRRLRGDVPVLVCTGYEDRIDKLLLQSHQGVRILAKPMTGQELVEAITEAME